MITQLSRRGVTCTASFMPGWVKPITADPRADADAMCSRAALGRQRRASARQELEAQGRTIYAIVQRLNDGFGERWYADGPDGLPCRPPEWGAWSWQEATVVITTTLGAPEPPWDETTYSWWFNKNHGLFDWVRTPADVARIPVPDWAASPQVRAMFAAQARWRAAFPGDPAHVDMLWPMPIPGGRWVMGGAYPSFIDLGICLLGIDNFLAVLAGNPPLADALLEKCFELSTTYSDYLFVQDPVPISGWLGFGGDVSTMLSPRLYERYGNGWDARLSEHVRARHPEVPPDAPWNLHSCGPSVHLIDVWARHPCRSQIACIQTRLIPGAVARLRASLPNANLQLTAHPGHFDFASADPGAVRRVVRQTVLDAGCRDMELHIFAAAHSPEVVPVLEANLQACYETFEELEKEC